MDKSDRYINMCRLAKEVQTHWMPERGDFFVNEAGEVECYLPEKNGDIRQGMGISKENNNLISITPFSWLPRQSQLIELAQTPGINYQDVTFQFLEWSKNKRIRHADQSPPPFPSLEQVWLVFVMEKKFLKSWNENTGWETIAPIPPINA